MPIQFNVVERGEPGIAGGGNKKWYAAVVLTGEATLEHLVTEIEKSSSLTEVDIRGVIIALEYAIQKELSNGKVVRLDRLGNFYPSLTSGGANSKAEFKISMIKEAKINYRPSKRIANALKLASFQKKR